MEEASFTNSRGEKLVGDLHPNSGNKGIILCHGYTSSKENKITWAKYLSDKFTVLRFDFSGHGESDGELQDITLSRLLDDLNSAIDFLSSKGIKEIGIAGHSLGGSLSILAASKVKTIIPIAAPTDYSGIDLNQRGIKNFNEDSKNYDFYDIIKKTNTPILFIHGDKDELVPLWHSEKALAVASKDSKLEIIQGMDHDYNGVNEYHEKIMNITKEWFSNHV